MRVRWFGEPWPSASERAAICDEDAYRIATPVGATCLKCGDLIEPDDRGVVMASSPGIENSWFDKNLGLTVCATHIDCLIDMTIPDIKLPFSRKGTSDEHRDGG